MSVAGAGRLWAAALSIAALGLAPAQGAAEEPESQAPPRAESLLDDAMERAMEGVLPEGFSDAEAYLALLSNRAGRHVRAREQAEAILERDPASVGAHVVLGLALYEGEGNFGLARYHFERALRLFEEQYGDPPPRDTPWRWQVLAYHALAHAYGSMGRDEKRLEVLDERAENYGLRPSQRAWPLMRLGRYREARAAAAAALALESQPEGHTEARIALCGIAGELLERSLAADLCLEALESDTDGRDEAILLSNAAEASLGVLRFDAAERLYLECARVPTYGTAANPWMELTHMYVAQGRILEARDAMRQMFAWRASQPAIVDAQSRSAIDLASAVFLLAAGYPTHATVASGRGVDRPARQGVISFAPSARQAGAALTDRVVNRAAAEQRWEQASWLAWREAWGARIQALGHTLRAWWSTRRARGLLADERMLLHSVTPYAAGSAVLPEWLKPELVVVGSGPIEAVLREARRVEAVAGDEGYRLALEVEAAHRAGRPREAAELAQRALAELPRAEVLLRARVAARGGRAALDAGQRRLALELLGRALQGDPGVIRRLGIALPCVFEVAPGSLAREAAELLARSPRLDEVGFGFRIRVRQREEVVESCLIGMDGSLHACARATPQPGETPEAQARRLAAEFHAAAFAPRVDLTQADLDSLDGATTTVGIRGTDRVRELLRDWNRAESPEATPLVP